MSEIAKKGKQEEEKKPRRRVKKARGHGGHHGGAWKVAYADFVTAMMALFLVLWLVSQADTKLKEAIANYFRSPGVFDTQKGGILSGGKKTSKEPEVAASQEGDEQSLLDVGQNLKKKFETRPEFSKIKDQIKIDVTDEGLRIQILDKAERVSFPVGSAQLTEEAKLILKEIAQAICTLPNPLKIGGHTDSRVFPSENGYTNWELSADRANAARRALQAECVKPDQIERILGYADTEPIDPSDRYAPANRRISITVMRIKAAAANDQTEAKPKAEIKTASLKNDQQIDKKSEKPTLNKKETVDKEIKSKEDEAKEKKLLEEGKVTVGEPDKLPSAPTIRETKNQ